MTAKTYPLAVYTAHEGLAWHYDETVISYKELDACRTAFGRKLPDFDRGEPGFDGVWVTRERVFVMRCQHVSNWDSRGRNAVYLAVTWVSRDEAAGLDIEGLLAHSALYIPKKNPPLSFDFKGVEISLSQSGTLQNSFELNGNFEIVCDFLTKLSSTAMLCAQRYFESQTIFGYWKDCKPDITHITVNTASSSWASKAALFNPVSVHQSKAVAKQCNKLIGMLATIKRHTDFVICFMLMVVVFVLVMFVEHRGKVFDKLMTYTYQTEGSNSGDCEASTRNCGDTEKAPKDDCASINEVQVATGGTNNLNNEVVVNVPTNVPPKTTDLGQRKADKGELK